MVINKMGKIPKEEVVVEFTVLPYQIPGLIEETKNIPRHYGRLPSQDMI